MSSMPLEQKIRLQNDLLELTKACPFDQCNPVDCPLFELRIMPRRKRLFWFKALSEEDLVYLASYHYACLATKVQLPLAEIGS